MGDNVQTVDPFGPGPNFRTISVFGAHMSTEDLTWRVFVSSLHNDNNFWGELFILSDRPSGLCVRHRHTDPDTGATVYELAALFDAGINVYQVTVSPDPCTAVCTLLYQFRQHKLFGAQGIGFSCNGEEDGLYVWLPKPRHATAHMVFLPYQSTHWQCKTHYDRDFQHRRLPEVIEQVSATGYTILAHNTPQTYALHSQVSTTDVHVQETFCSLDLNLDAFDKNWTRMLSDGAPIRDCSREHMETMRQGGEGAGDPMMLDDAQLGFTDFSRQQGFV